MTREDFLSFKKKLPFGMSSELITENGNTVDCTAGLEVGLDLLGGGAIINLG